MSAEYKNELDEKINKIKPSKDTLLEEDSISVNAEKIIKPDEQRNENEKQHIHCIKISLLWSLAIAIIIIGIVILWHLIFSEEFRWLSKDEIMNLKGMFISGVGGAILAKFGNKLMD